MGKIKKILENELVGGTQTTDVYPVTSVKAVYDEDNERLDNIINRRGVVNISTNYNSDHIAEVLTLEQAIAKVPSKDRVLGFQGKFQTSEGWKSYIFTGESISDWSNISEWIELISSAVLVQELGDSTSKAISQKAVTKEINSLSANTGIDEYETFSTSKSYSAGTTVFYENTLYTFITDHIAGTWDVNEVKATSLKNEIEGKVTELEKINDFLKVNEFNKEKTNYLLNKDGTISEFDGSSIYKFSATQNQLYAVLGEITGSRAICFYDEEDDYISGINNICANNVSVFNTPENTAYVRFCARNYSTSATKKVYQINTSNSNQIEQIIDGIKSIAITNQTELFGSYTKMENPLTQTGYYGTNQQIGEVLAGETTSNGYKSGAIDISNCVRIKITGFITTSGRCTVITDENNIVLQFSKENQGETAEFVRGDEDWKYLYCSSQFNTVTIYLYTLDGLVNRVNNVDDKIASLDDDLKNKIDGVYNVTKETLGLVVSESGNFLNYQNGNVQANSSYSPKAYTNIKVIPKSKVSLHIESCPMAGQRGFAFYNISGTYISGEAYVVGTLDYEVTVPNNAYFMGITVFNDENFNIAVTDISIENVVSGLVDSTKSLLETEKKFNELTNIEFIIPSKVTGTIGHNTNINLDNIIPENGTTEKAQIFRYSGGDSYDGDVEIIPEEEGTNDYVIGYMPSTSYGIKDQDLPLIVVSDAVGNGLTKKVMVIGESTTDNNYVIKHLHDLFEEDVMNITLLGTRQDSEGNHHEGRGGWTTRNYLEDESVKEVPNAFYNPETEGFDFSYYLTHNSIDTPDIVIFNMGLNDLDIGGGTLTANNLTTMINQIKAANNNVIIIVALPNLPTALKQTWGYSSNRRYRLLVNTIKPLIEAFDNRENENIFISPVYLYLHPKWDMPYEMKYVNSEHNEGNNGMKIPVAISPAPTHPSQIGYYKMADCYYNTIKYAISKFVE